MRLKVIRNCAWLEPKLGLIAPIGPKVIDLISGICTPRQVFQGLSLQGHVPKIGLGLH